MKLVGLVKPGHFNQKTATKISITEKGKIYLKAPKVGSRSREKQFERKFGHRTLA